MIALQQRVFSRSNIGAFFINKQSFEENEFVDREDEYNRVMGISIDEDFSSDLGFVRRTGIFKGIVSAERVFWPKKGIIQNHGFQFFPILLWDPSLSFKNTDYDFRSSWEATFNDQSQFNLGMTNSFTFLFDSFDPTNTDDALELPGDQGYHYNSVEFGYQSDMRKRFAFERDLKIKLGLYHNREWCVEETSERVEKEIFNTRANPRFRKTSETISDWKDRNISAHKIMLMCTKSSADAIFPILADQFSQKIQIYRSNDTLIELAPKTVSKLSAIKLLLRDNESVADVISFG
ncbi:hypothetical protein GQR58_030336 [Nymphon striatum]|nr:hypothetical protein GQR58_030336 [Nymphon striatum]